MHLDEWHAIILGLRFIWYDHGSGIATNVKLWCIEQYWYDKPTTILITRKYMFRNRKEMIGSIIVNRYNNQLLITWYVHKERHLRVNNDKGINWNVMIRSLSTSSYLGERNLSVTFI